MTALGFPNSAIPPLSNARVLSVVAFLKIP